MKKIVAAVVVFSATLLWAQSSGSSPGNTGTDSQKSDEVTVQGCLARLSGHYVLMTENHANTYQLQGTKLKAYLGKRVEVTGPEAPSMSTSSDAITRLGNASPVTITVKSIKTIGEQCQTQ